MIEIEMYVAYTDHTWDTMTISIRKPPNPGLMNLTEWRTELESRGIQQIQKLFGGSTKKVLAFCGIYYLPEEEEETE